jgi:hypothetical protein
MENMIAHGRLEIAMTHPYISRLKRIDFLNADINDIPSPQTYGTVPNDTTAAGLAQVFPASKQMLPL